MRNKQANGQTRGEGETVRTTISLIENKANT